MCEKLAIHTISKSGHYQIYHTNYQQVQNLHVAIIFIGLLHNIMNYMSIKVTIQYSIYSIVLFPHYSSNWYTCQFNTTVVRQQLLTVLTVELR